jgi:hypothetical protein
MKAFQSTEEVTSYRNIQDFKHKISSLLCRVIFAYLDPDPQAQMNPNPIRIGIRVTAANVQTNKMFVPVERLDW